MFRTVSYGFVVIFTFGGFILMISYYNEEFIFRGLSQQTLLALNSNKSSMMEPELEGWPPGKSLDLTLYLRPDETTTLMRPSLLFESEQEDSTDHILIICHTSFNGYDLRTAIRNSWASPNVTSQFSTSVVFLFGTTSNETIQNALADESETYGDILQEDFIDSYNNLTLKSMFMLKYVTENIPVTSNYRYLFKVDDDSFVNLKALSKYIQTMSRFHRTIVGRVLGSNNPVNRPSHQKTLEKWQVPKYIYKNKETFPNAISGSGYLLKVEDVDCLYKHGLGTPFLNLEDIFITGLVARQCKMKLLNHPKFHFMGKSEICDTEFQHDILVHGVKNSTYMGTLFKLYNSENPCEQSNQD